MFKNEKYKMGGLGSCSMCGGMCILGSRQENWNGNRTGVLKMAQCGQMSSATTKRSRGLLSDQKGSKRAHKFTVHSHVFLGSSLESLGWKLY